MPAYVLPSLRQARAEGRPTVLLTLAVAAWFRYLRGYDMRGRPLSVVDQRDKQLTTLALLGVSDPRPLLALREVFGDLGEDMEFVGSLEHTLRDFDRLGVRAVVRKGLGVPSHRSTWKGNDDARSVR
jgi:fructuronate reductase/mannitol 2-dehydrogenase